MNFLENSSKKPLSNHLTALFQRQPILYASIVYFHFLIEHAIAIYVFSFHFSAVHFGTY